jgi:hypothetical protein
MSEKMRITANGNVGIGTTDPGGLLHLSSGGPSLILDANSQGTNLKRTYIATSEVAAGDFVIGTRNDNNTVKSRNLYITNTGNVGIGTTNPSHTLEVNGETRLGGGDYGSATVMSVAPGTIGFDAPGNSGGRFYISGSNGNVGIGTTTPDTKLAVNGTIHTKEVKVDLTGWPDYVFKPKYKLPSLTEVKTYIDKNQHLPDMPSETEVAKNGINLGEMVKIQTKKIEELTLYLMEENEKNKEQQSEINQLKKQLNAITQALIKN